MDSELEHLQHLGLFGICKQGCKLIYSHKKIFTQITLAFILPLTLITLLEPLVCDALFGRLTIGEPNEFEIFSGRPREDSSNPLFWSYKVAHILFLAVFILLSTSTLVCSVACIYTAKPITFKKVISIIPKVWKRPFLSISCNIVFMVAYYVVAIVVFLSWMRRISDGEVKNNIPWVIGLVIWIILIIFVFVYNNLIWQLASVLSVLEPVYVVKAMMKSRVLIKGKLFAATFILLATIVPLGFAEKLFQGYVMHENLSTIHGCKAFFYFLMAGGAEEKSSDFYAVLGLKKECSALDLRNAYKKLALRWHPDRCSASGNLKFVEEAKKKFQAIQEAYSVLSDESKRFLYDVGAYDCDDDEDENGMEEFLGEMTAMMSQTKPCENGQQSFEDLQTLFDEMFQKDMEAFNTISPTSHSNSKVDITSSSFTYNDDINSNNKRNCSSVGLDKSKVDFDLESLDLRNFCFGVEDGTQNSNGGRGNGRRQSRKQKVSSQGSKISV